MLYSQADSKKKSNLMMSVFEPGPEPLPWLGKISHLGPTSGNTPLCLLSQQTCFKHTCSQAIKLIFRPFANFVNYLFCNFVIVYFVIHVTLPEFHRRKDFHPVDAYGCHGL